MEAIRAQLPVMRWCKARGWCLDGRGHVGHDHPSKLGNRDRTHKNGNNVTPHDTMQTMHTFDMCDTCPFDRIRIKANALCAWTNMPRATASHV